MQIIKMIGNMERSSGTMIEKLKYWMFQKGKSCRHCCLWCEYYDLCRAEILEEKEQKRENEAFINSIEIAIDWGMYIAPDSYKRYLDLTEESEGEKT